jgi:hypothetical protein
MKKFMTQLSTASVSLCSLNVVGKIKMGGHEVRMARMGITEAKDHFEQPRVSYGVRWTEVDWIQVADGGGGL